MKQLLSFFVQPIRARKEKRPEVLATSNRASDGVQISIGNVVALVIQHIATV
jgi:hypothetical protein